MNRKPVVVSCMAALLFFNAAVSAQTSKNKYFNASSPQNVSDKNYGSVTVAADKQTIVIGTVIASGENVKSLNIQINNGFVFKLAPALSGSIINYVGSTLNIVLQPGDKAKIDFVIPAKGAAARQIYVAGEIID